MKKVLVILLMLAVATTAFAGGRGQAAAGDGLISVGIVNNPPHESGYRAANVAEMARVFSRENGYNARTANVTTLAEQIQAATDFINAGVKYLLICPADMSGWVPTLQAAQRAGVHVFVFDRMMEPAAMELITAFVGSDMVRQGQRAVAWLEAQNRPGGYRFIHINGQMGSAAQQGRGQPLHDAVRRHANWTIVREGTGGDTWSSDEARRIVEAAIAAGEDFNTIYAENDGMAEGAMAALQAAGISHGVYGDVWIMGFDFNRFALRYVMEGLWNFNGQCSPFQADVIHGFIQQLEAGEELNLPSKIVINPETIIDYATITQEFIDAYGLGD